MVLISMETGFLLCLSLILAVLSHLESFTNTCVL